MPAYSRHMPAYSRHMPEITLCMCVCIYVCVSIPKLLFPTRDYTVITGSTNYSLFYIMPTNDESDLSYKRYYQEGRSVNLLTFYFLIQYLYIVQQLTESYKGGLTYAQQSILMNTILLFHKKAFDLLPFRKFITKVPEIHCVLQ